jgi:hypothetical protein
MIMGGFHLVEPAEPSIQGSKTVAEAENGSQTELDKGRVTILTLEMLQELLKAPELKI